MLAQLEPAHNDFHALASYLVHGIVRPTPTSRVAWTMARNLPTDDPMLAAKLMAATAELSTRCKDACLHTIIAWREDEFPSPEAMQEIAIKTLALAGLGDHEALIMGHGDRAHPHCHLMINRINPDTGKAWDMYRSHMRFDAIMRQLSDEHGFLYVPAHAFNPELTDDLPKGPNSNATYAAKRGANTRRPQWSRKAARDYGARLSEHLDMATGWDDIEALLAEDGLTLEAKGRGQKSGLVVGDGQGYAKFSALGLALTAKGFAKKFGRAFAPAAKRQRSTPARSRPPPSRRPPARNIWSIDAIDIARAIGSKEEVRQAVRDIKAVRKARLANGPVMLQLDAELRDHLKAATSLTTPKPRPRRSPRSRDKRPRPGYRER